MKLYLKSTQILVFVGMTLSCVPSSHGRLQPSGELPEQSDIETIPAIQNAEEEAILLEELKGYIIEDNPDNDPRASGIIQALTDFGSTNVIQFFLDNIDWPHRAHTANLSTVRPIHPLPARTIYGGLSEIGNVSLRQCVDALLKEMSWTARFDFLSIFTYQLHGEDFVREAESIAEALPDSDSRKVHWKALAKVAREDVESKKQNGTSETPTGDGGIPETPDTHSAATSPDKQLSPVIARSGATKQSSTENEQDEVPTRHYDKWLYIIGACVFVFGIGGVFYCIRKK